VTDDDRPYDEVVARLLEQEKRERSLVLNVEADEAYGFRCEGAFGDAMTVCIVRTGNSVTLTGKSRAGQFDEEREVRKTLLATEWDRLRLALDLVEFWTLPERHDRMGLDGYEWTIEGRQGTRYHSSDCWSPDSGPYFRLGSLFAELAGFNAPA
jgi:hypothetical protein